MELKTISWGELPSPPEKGGNAPPSEVLLATFSSENLRVSVTNYGGYVTSVQYKNKTKSQPNGEWTELTLGFFSIDEYLKDTSYIGATVGRFANRIANASYPVHLRPPTSDENSGGSRHRVIFTKLTKNNNGHCLHSSAGALSKRVWEMKPYNGDDGGSDGASDPSSVGGSVCGVHLSIVSPHGDGGFNGT